jgi:hypothetical protein
MPSYPVHVPRTSYKGSDAKKRLTVATRNSLATKLEAYISAQDAAQIEPHLVLSYGSIAMATGIPYEQVRDILFSVDAGSGGITMFKDAASIAATKRQLTKDKQAKAVDEGKKAGEAGEPGSRNPFPRPKPGEEAEDSTLHDSWNFGHGLGKVAVASQAPDENDL